MSQCKIPLSNEIAGRTENLDSIEQRQDTRGSDYTPFATHKECFALRFGAPNRPGVSSICRPTIDRTLIHKNELIWLVFADSVEIIQSFFGRTLSSNFCDLVRKLESFQVC